MNFILVKNFLIPEVEPLDPGRNFSIPDEYFAKITIPNECFIKTTTRRWQVFLFLMNFLMQIEFIVNEFCYSFASANSSNSHVCKCKFACANRLLFANANRILNFGWSGNSNTLRKVFKSCVFEKHYERVRNRVIFWTIKNKQALRIIYGENH